MKPWPLLSTIASACCLTVCTTAIAQELNPPTEDLNIPPEDLSILSEDELLPAEAFKVNTAGLRINESRIVTAFHGHLIRYIGECPGRSWSGNATHDNVRFISHNVSPGKHLRVTLTNLTSGESMTRKYTKEGKGSTDFQVINLGTGNGDQDIQYSIFNKKSDAILEEGEFTYGLKTSSRTRRRYGEWRTELYCASDKNHAIKDCEILGEQDRLYCAGQRTSRVKNQYISKRRRFHKPHHHKKSRHRHHPKRVLVPHKK